MNSAVHQVCSIADCGRQAKSKRNGWCEAHYKRWWRYGDPLSGGTYKGEPERYLNEVVLTFADDQCLIWPYTRNNNGYAQISRDGRMQLVTRIVCEEINGPPPSFDSEAAHSCGRGVDGCVSKTHLSWKSHEQNMADKQAHGTHNRGRRNPNAKINEQIAAEVRSLSTHLSQRKIAQRFGITQSSVSRILSGEIWCRHE